MIFIYVYLMDYNTHVCIHTQFLYTFSNITIISNTVVIYFPFAFNANIGLFCFFPQPRSVLVTLRGMLMLV